MLEPIPSEFMREYLRDKNRELNDWEKAALIWNCPNTSYNERLDSLRELRAATADFPLKKQLLERILYEEKSFAAFKSNSKQNYVYLVIDDNRELYGCFSDYNNAYTFTLSCVEFYSDMNVRFFEIIKQPICRGKNPIGEGDILRLNLRGEIIFFFSSEEEPFDSFSPLRFENHFFRIPCGFTPRVVRVCGDSKFGVVNSSEKQWEAYMDAIAGAEPCFEDINVNVFYLSEDGLWIHEHINPLYLEPFTPVSADGDTVTAAHIEAANALVAYFNNLTEDNAARVLTTAKKYSDSLRVSKIGEIANTDDIIQ